MSTATTSNLKPATNNGTNELTNDLKAIKDTFIASRNTINQLTDKSPEPNEDLSSTQSKEKRGLLIDGSGPTPPPSGTSSKSVPKKEVQIEKMFETFHQSPTGEFKPTFYNPFEVKHRRRTSRGQFRILEKAFMDNCKPSATVRKALAQELNMSVRSIQVWFQNRRAKLKTMMKNGQLTDKQLMEYIAAQKKADESQSSPEDHQSIQHQDSPSSFEDSESSDIENSQQESLNGANRSVNGGFRGSFNIEKRNFPISKTLNTPVNVITTEHMKLADSYPNQSRNRSYSLPDIQRSPQLPFKQLQEALFGNNSQSSQLESRSRDQCSVNNNSYANSAPLNAFQQYYRASNAALTHVNSNNGSSLLSGSNTTYNYSNPNGYNYYPGATAAPQISLPHLNILPLSHVTGGNPFDYQPVDPNRFRPRSSSFAVGRRPRSNSTSVSTGPMAPIVTNPYDSLAVIKEDSPITEYMSLPNAYEGGHANNAVYVDSHHDYSGSVQLANQVEALDLDYFMAANGSQIPTNQGIFLPPPHVNYSAYPHDNHSSSIASSSGAPSSLIQSPCGDGSDGNYINELAFLPQPTHEILLSTLIDDEHFLH